MERIKSFDEVINEGEKRIRLDADDFVKLVSGEDVFVGGAGGDVRIILADIGFDQMIKAIEDAQKK